MVMNEDVQLIHGNCLEVLKGMPDNSVDSIVTDPPYGLSFMGKKWDYDVPEQAVWEERFKDCIDRRMVKNGGGEYFAWDMQVAWIVWQGRAAMLQGSETATDNTNQQF